MNSIFNDPGFWHRLQFGFTIVYHYLFPQLTMGLAWFLVYWKWRALRTGDEKYNQAVRFWAKIFGLNFAVGVVTGIPMEFQFGTNWADFSKYAGGVVGQTLAMEGMFAFFLESAFVGALIWGEKRLGPRGHFAAAIAVALGSWLSGYFILVTNSFMQHPVGYQIEPNGSLGIASMSAYLLNPWAFVQFAHNQLAAVVTGACVVTAIGAFYALRGLHPVQARLYLRAGTCVDRSTTWCREATRQSDRSSWCTQFSRLRPFRKFCPWAKRFPEGSMAGQPGASLLLIPSHDHPRDVVHRPDGFGDIAELARKTRIKSLVALGFDAGVSVSLHRQHARLDDGRVGASTMVDLRTVSHPRRLQQSS